MNIPADGSKPATRKPAPKRAIQKPRLSEKDIDELSQTVLAAVMDKIIPLLEKIERVTHGLERAERTEISAEQKTAQQLQHQLQTMAQMKLKSLEERVDARIKQMLGK